MESETGWPEETHVHVHKKGIGLQDLFDLALTALAFLAFGTFIMNLVLFTLLVNILKAFHSDQIKSKRSNCNYK